MTTIPTPTLAPMSRLRRNGRAAVNLFRVHLAGQIDLQCAVDRGEVPHLRQRLGRVGIAHWSEHNLLVDPECLKQAATAQRSSGHGQPAVDRLACVRDRAPFDQIQDGVRDHPGVQAEIAMIPVRARRKSELSMWSPWFGVP